MLRIITEQRGNAYRLELHGTVAGEGISVLERHWLSILDEAPSAIVTVALLMSEKSLTTGVAMK